MSQVNIQSDPVLARHLSRHGQFTSASWARPLALRKEYKSIHTLIKSTLAVVRAGIDYDNVSNVIDKRADGTLPAVNAGLPWGEWATDENGRNLFPHVITHKGNVYVRLYPTSGSFPRVVYTLDGAVITKETARAYALASEFNDGDAPDCFTVKRINVLSLDGVTGAPVPTSLPASSPVASDVYSVIVAPMLANVRRSIIRSQSIQN
jgi:hypothetical protein